MSEIDISCCEKNSPPHTQLSQMATEFTSPATGENTMSKLTSSATAEVTSPVDGSTDTSGLQDEKMNSLCPRNSNNSMSIGGGPSSKNKRKHRRGKPKTKNTKPYKKTNWKFQVPPYGRSQSGAYGRGGVGGGGNSSSTSGRRIKLNRSRSLVPYNTNKFLMEEHLAEVPSALLTPSGRTRDSSFSIDSEDNYFYSLPEDEEEFLSKEFANVYEKARMERLETLTKQQLIEECLQIEDRYSEQGAQKQHQLYLQKISAEYLSKIRLYEEKIRDLSKENFELKRQLELSSACKSSTTQRSTPMDSSSEDSESDSSSSSSKSSSSSQSSLSAYSSPGEQKNDVQMADASLSADEEKDVANGVSNCNGYHSVGSNTPPSSPSRPSSPISLPETRRRHQQPSSHSTDP